jgi:formylglycine-generating enzyme required for sulfatase activity
MAGNVSEWVADWYDEYYYETSQDKDPPGPKYGEYKVIKGGPFWGTIEGGLLDIRSSNREAAGPIYSDFHTGFRCAKNRLIIINLDFF